MSVYTVAAAAGALATVAAAVRCRRAGRARAAAATGQLAPPEVGPCASAAGRKINCGRMPGARNAEKDSWRDAVRRGRRGRAREKRERRKTAK